MSATASHNWKSDTNATHALAWEVKASMLNSAALVIDSLGKRVSLNETIFDEELMAFRQACEFARSAFCRIDDGDEPESTEGYPLAASGKSSSLEC